MPRSRARSMWRCPTASASAAPTPASSSSGPPDPPMAGRRIAALALAGVLVLGGVGVGAVRFADRQLTAPGPLSQARNLVVPHGSHAAVAAALLQGGVIASE